MFCGIYLQTLMYQVILYLWFFVDCKCQKALIHSLCGGVAPGCLLLDSQQQSQAQQQLSKKTHRNPCFKVYFFLTSIAKSKKKTCTIQNLNVNSSNNNQKSCKLYYILTFCTFLSKKITKMF